MAEEKISNTTMELLTLEIAQANHFSTKISEKIGSADLSEAERKFWLGKLEKMLIYSNEVLALAETWAAQQAEFNLLNDPALDLSEMAH